MKTMPAAVKRSRRSRSKLSEPELSPKRQIPLKKKNCAPAKGIDGGEEKENERKSDSLLQVREGEASARARE